MNESWVQVLDAQQSKCRPKLANDKHTKILTIRVAYKNGENHIITLVILLNWFLSCTNIPDFLTINLFKGSLSYCSFLV